MITQLAAHADWLPSITRALDALVVVLLALLVLTLWRAPRAWAERESRLRELHDSFVQLVREAMAQAAELDARLERHAARLDQASERSDASDAAPATRSRATAHARGADFVAAADVPMRAADRSSSPPTVSGAEPAAPAVLGAAVEPRAEAGSELGRRLHQVLADGPETPVEEVARRLDVPVAEVRLMLDLLALRREQAEAGRQPGA